MWLLLRVLPALVLPLALLADSPPSRPSPQPRGKGVLEGLLSAACGSASLQRVAEAGGQEPCLARGRPEAAASLRPAVAALRPFATLPVAEGDGTLVGRQRLVTLGPVALDFVAYLSSGLVVGTYAGVLRSVDAGLTWSDASAGLRPPQVRSLAVDPQYTDAAGFDFRPRTTSPVIDAAIAVGIDRNGSRPGNFDGPAPDMGAHEVR
jgi:hypothetical protein